MYWAFDSPVSKAAGAYPPEPLNLPYGQREAGEERLRGTELQRAYAVSGREVRPSDCGPVRVISRFGHVVRAPGRVTLQREDPPQRWRDFQDDSAAYGPARVGGDRWHGTESGFVASWIAGSEYLKISTGVLIFFPKGHLLYQGPIPNRQILDDVDAASDQLDVMAGMEPYTPDRTREIDGQLYGVAALNIIVRAPQNDAVMKIERGQVIGWFHLIAPPADQRLQPFPVEDGRTP